jgi:hypothetical protein
MDATSFTSPQVILFGEDVEVQDPDGHPIHLVQELTDR